MAASGLAGHGKGLVRMPCHQRVNAIEGRKGGAGIFHPLRGHLSPYARMRQRHHHIGALRAQPWHISNRRL